MCFGLVWFAGHTHVVVSVVVLNGKGYFSEGTEFAEFPGFIVRVVATQLATVRPTPGFLYSQNVNRAHTTRHQIQNRHSDQLPIQPIALMPGTKLFLFRVRAGRRPLDTGAQEALEILGFPSGDVFLVDFGLVFEEEVESVGVSNGSFILLMLIRTLPEKLSHLRDSLRSDERVLVGVWLLGQWGVLRWRIRIRGLLRGRRSCIFDVSSLCSIVRNRLPEKGEDVLACLGA